MLDQPVSATDGPWLAKQPGIVMKTIELEVLDTRGALFGNGS